MGVLLSRKGSLVSLAYDCKDDYNAMRLFDLIRGRIIAHGDIHFKFKEAGQTIQVKFEELDS